MNSWLKAERTKTTRCNATRHRCFQLTLNWGATVLFFTSIGIPPSFSSLMEVAAEERCSGVFAPLNLLPPYLDGALLFIVLSTGDKFIFNPLFQV
jgi:hypothetical protein